MDTLPHFSTDARESLYETGYIFYEQGKFQEAIHFFRALTVLAPTETRFWLGLGSAQKGNKEYADALESLALADYFDTKSDGRIPFFGTECYRALGKDKEATRAKEEASKRAKQANDAALLHHIEGLPHA